MNKAFKSVLPMIAASILFLARASAQLSPTANPCRNPGFGLLNPAGNNFPVNWTAVKSAVGQSGVEIDSTSYSGRIALRMYADAEPDLRCESLRSRDGRILVALWLAVPPQDDTAARPVTLKVRCTAERLDRIEAVDTLRAHVQRIEAEQEGEHVIIRKPQVTESPIIVRL